MGGGCRVNNGMRFAPVGQGTCSDPSNCGTNQHYYLVGNYDGGSLRPGDCADSITELVEINTCSQYFEERYNLVVGANDARADTCLCLRPGFELELVENIDFVGQAQIFQLGENCSFGNDILPMF